MTYHTTPSDRAADEQRYQRLMDAGFTVCVIWEPDLWKSLAPSSTPSPPLVGMARGMSRSWSIRPGAHGRARTSVPPSPDSFWWLQRVPRHHIQPPEREGQAA